IRHVTSAPPALQVSKLDATQPEILSESEVKSEVGKTLPAAMFDEATSRTDVARVAPTRPGNGSLGLAATINADDVVLSPFPSIPPANVAPVAPAPLAQRRPPLSGVASLLIGAGLGAVVLIILALLLLSK
ncbi:MAG: hypothetical protein ABJE95_09340, partial [Byssovorax sp.]